MTATPKTFTAHGHTWTSHTPGDPMPCDGERLVCILTRYNKDHDPCEIEFTTPRRAEGWTWGNTLRTCEIIGWRYADEPQAKPASPWRPIAEAPKDGTEVLYYSPTIGRWVGNHPPECCRGIWRKCSDETWDGGFVGNGNETHYMPLPEPPADS